MKCFKSAFNFLVMIPLLGALIAFNYMLCAVFLIDERNYAANMYEREDYKSGRMCTLFLLIESLVFINFQFIVWPLFVGVAYLTILVFGVWANLLGEMEAIDNAFPASWMVSRP